jgi:hypothetical protein
MAVIKVKPWGEGQGDHVLIEEENFNPDFHTKLEDEKTEEKKTTRRGRGRKKADEE